MAEIATRKLFENDRLILWELELAPGEQTGVHTHSNDYLTYVIEGATVEGLDAHGQSLGEFSLNSGEVNFAQVENGEIVFDGNRLSATHDVKNVSNKRYKELLLELKE